MECHYEWYDATHDYYAYLNAHYYAYLNAHYCKEKSFSNVFETLVSKQFLTRYLKNS